MTRAGPRPSPGFDLSDGRLWSGGREIPLTPTLFAMLRYFALNPDRLITKQELLDQVWPDTHVTEGLVKDYVRKIRKILDDDARRPRFIETARGMGYRFIGDISVSGAGDAPWAAAYARQSVPSVAVLPFADAPDGADQTYFSAGITEDIIAELSRFRSLIVIARDSSSLFSAQPAAINRAGRELGAQYLVQGSVHRAADRVRIHAQLIEAASGTCIWADRYDRELEDVFAVQDEVSTAIVSTLVGRLEEFGRRRAARKRPDNLEVYDLLLLGDWHLRQGAKKDVIEARRIFLRAIDLDPTNARAHAELAFSHLLEFWSDWTAGQQAAVDEAFALAKKAVALDEFDSRAHLYLAAAYQYGPANLELAEAEYRKAHELNPNDYDVFCLRSWLLALSGQADEGIACAAHAIRLCPLITEDCYAAQCFAAYSVERYDEALAALGSIAEPTNKVKAYFAMCYAQLGRAAEAKRAMADFLASASDEVATYHSAGRDRWQRYWATRFPFSNAADMEHMFEGLQKAGLP